MQTLLVPAPDAELAVIDGVSYFFLPEKQSLLALSPEVAAAWPRLQCGVLRGDPSGVIPDPLIEDLLAAGVLEAVQISEVTGGVPQVQILQIADFRIGLIYADEALHRELAPTYSNMAAPAEADRAQGVPVRAWITVDRHAERVSVALRGEAPRFGNGDALAPLLKLALTDAILDLTDTLLLHAAVIEMPSRASDPAAMLVVGDPGAGKSTLAMALARGGCALCGDDLAMLEWDGSVQAVPFPATLKTGSWDLFSARDAGRTATDLSDSVTSARSYLRPDDQHVRYLPLGASGRGAQGSLPVRWVVFLDRASGPMGDPRLQDLDVPDALSRLIAASWSGTEDLEPVEFKALAACLDGARCAVFRYSDLDPAVSALKAMADATEVVRDGAGQVSERVQGL